MPKAPHNSLQKKLSTKVLACAKRGNTTFVIGGSRDISACVTKGLKEKESGGSLGIICINHTLDVKPLVHEGLPHSESVNTF